MKRVNNKLQSSKFNLSLKKYVYPFNGKILLIEQILRGLGEITSGLCLLSPPSWNLQ